MTGQDIIDNAKLIYPVETFLNETMLVKLVNQAREKVNKLLALSYSEYSFTTEANQWRYTLDELLCDLQGKSRDRKSVV